MPRATRPTSTALRSTPFLFWLSDHLPLRLPCACCSCCSCKVADVQANTSPMTIVTKPAAKGHKLPKVPASIISSTTSAMPAATAASPMGVRGTSKLVANASHWSCGVESTVMPQSSPSGPSPRRPPRCQASAMATWASSRGFSSGGGNAATAATAVAAPPAAAAAVVDGDEAALPWCFCLRATYRRYRSQAVAASAAHSGANLRLASCMARS
mmetsp:Transcript_8916/g.22276  ORF Transcript_8916/g.22276 Transcript_8916/m.22276 type:complete len:213 (+) Transcript_8916:281-919(+)